jgi:catalase-peroxidase
MGPVARLVGPEVAPPQIWQDPVPEVDHPLVGDAHVADLKRRIAGSGLSVADLVSTAWVAAANFRDSDKRGGVNGARIRLAPQNQWEYAEPDRVQGVIAQLDGIRADFNGAQADGVKISLADMIVLGGNVGVEMAAKAAGRDVTVPFRPGRTDATAEMTDAEGLAPLELKSDGFRNYHSNESWYRPADALVDRANLLSLTAPEMTVLVGGMRAMDANHGGAEHGVFTKRPGQLTNDFFANLLTMDNEWRKKGDGDVYEAVSRATGEVVWTGTSVDLVFGSHSQLRALAEVYASADGADKFVDDFVAAWTKVMELDRFDLHR